MSRAARGPRTSCDPPDQGGRLLTGRTSRRTRAAVLHEHSAPPRYGEFDDPRPSGDAVVVDVEASGLAA
ncbi:hypothetical protein ABZW11_41085 [Nonomuraea sp. NPDC004580]|uniref:hypothetical protein n=1 Tax=Nonomuraea sp. NPDC004580 TaxID=3154552 RepID=UPI0033BCF189